MAFQEKVLKLIGQLIIKRKLTLRLNKGVEEIIYSRLFETNYNYKKGHLGVNKFNIISIRSRLNLFRLEELK